MASELERIANRLRYLSGQADQHRATIHRASRGFSDTAQTIAHTKYPAPDGVDREPPQQLVGRLTAAARGADRAIGPLATTARLLRDFAAGLASTSVGLGPAPIPGGTGASAEYPPAGPRPTAPSTAPEPLAVPAGERADQASEPPGAVPSSPSGPAHAAPERSGEDHPRQPGGQRGGRHRAGSVPPAMTPTPATSAGLATPR